MADKIAFIGAGNMGGALIRTVCRGTDAENVLIYDIQGEKAETLARELGCRAFRGIREMLPEAGFIVFAVKPQVIGGVLRETAPDIKRALDKGRSITAVSIAAGVRIASIREGLAECGLGLPIVRLMPNMAALVGRGVLLLARDGAVGDEAEARLAALLAPAGRIERVTEEQLDLGTAISGCGPAYGYMFIEALADGGVQIGLPRDLAMRLAAQTLAGAAEMALQTGLHPGALKDSVCSPGGTTIAGVHELEKRAFRGAAAAAVIAANRRNEELLGSQ